MTHLSQILDRWRSSRTFLLTAHANPDGDAVGSLVGLAHVLALMGKTGHILVPQGLPDRFSWLTAPWPVVSSPPGLSGRCIVILDCADLDRVGTELAAVFRAQDVLNIDHHTGNTLFGSLNWVDPAMSSVGEMIALAARRLGFPLQGHLGEALYLALMADTGSLSFSNTTPQTLDIVSEILACGLDLDGFQAKLQRQWPLAKLHLHGRAMQDVSVRGEGKIGIIRAPRVLRDQTGATLEDCEGLVDYVRRLRGVVVAVSLREEEGGVKFSLRTWGEVNVRDIAADLGGGGHPNAAGGSIPGPLQDAEERIVQTICARTGWPHRMD
jgi:phosphoesterase RecJ-like protein